MMIMMTNTSRMMMMMMVGCCLPALQLLGKCWFHWDALQIDGRIIRMRHKGCQNVRTAIPVNWSNILGRRCRLLHVACERYDAAHFNVQIRWSGYNRFGIWRRHCKWQMERAQNWLIALLGIRSLPIAWARLQIQIQILSPNSQSRLEYRPLTHWLA